MLNRTEYGSTVKSQLLVVFILALMLRSVFVITVPYSPWSDAAVYDGLGWRMSRGLGYVSETGEVTAWYPPLYPLILSGIYSLLGHSILAARMLNVLLDSVTTVLLYCFVNQMCPDVEHLGRRLPFLTGLLYAVNPITIYMSGVTMPEIFFTTLLMGTVFVAFHMRLRVQQSIHRSTLIMTVCSYAVLGLLGGFAALTKPVFVPIWIVLVYMATGSRNHKAKILPMAIALSFLLLTISPWLIRNRRVSGRITLDTHLGMQLVNGTHYMGPFYSVPPAIKLLSVTEWDQNQVGVQLFLRHVRSYPLEYIWHTLRRAGHMVDLNVEAFILSSSGLTYGQGYSSVSSFLRKNVMFIPLAMLPLMQCVMWTIGACFGLYDSLGMPRNKALLTIILMWVVFHAPMIALPRYFTPMWVLMTIPFAHSISFVMQYGLRSSILVIQAASRKRFSDASITLVLVLAMGTWITTGLTLVSRAY